MQRKDLPFGCAISRLAPTARRSPSATRGISTLYRRLVGQALRLTSNAAYDGTPIWSPDSRSLAFSSDREGSKDVYIVKADGSGLRRLTYSSEKEVPVAFLDGSTLLFQSYVMPDVKDGMYPWDWFVQTYSLDLSKTIARPKLTVLILC